VITAPGNGTAGQGYLRASHADRDQVIDALKSAFVQGRLDKDDFDARVGRAFAARTYAELSAVTAGLPAGPAVAPPPGQPALARARPRLHASIKTGVCAIVAATTVEALRLGLTWPETALLAVFALIFAGIVAGIVALPIAGVLMLESRLRKRSSGHRLRSKPSSA
jgi:hypothetical protein